MRSLLSGILCLTLLDGSSAGGERPMDKLNPTMDPATKSGVYVPEDLQDAFKELTKMLHPDLVTKMKTGPENDMIMYHHSLGTWMRNNWLLWGGGRLAKFFGKKGVRHPDDMSGIILTSYWRHLNSKPLDFDQQCAWHVSYWETLKKPAEIQCPGGKKGEYLFALTDNMDHDKMPRVVHVARCGKDSYQVYEHKRGWYTPDKGLIRRIREVAASAGDGKLMSAPLSERAGRGN